MGASLREWLAGVLRDSLGYAIWLVVAAILGFFGRKLKTKGVEMLEGKEVEIPIGSIGKASVDLNDKGELEVAVSAKVDIVAELEKLALKTETKLDDAFIATLKKLTGRA